MRFFGIGVRENVFCVPLGEGLRRFTIVWNKEIESKHWFKIVKIKSENFPPCGVRIILPYLLLEYWFK